MANTFHVSVYVRSIPEAVEHYRKLLGIEPAKVKHDYAKFEIEDPPVIFSLSIGGEPGKLSHLILPRCGRKNQTARHSALHPDCHGAKGSRPVSFFTMRRPPLSPKSSRPTPTNTRFAKVSCGLSPKIREGHCKPVPPN